MKGFEYLQVPSQSVAHPGWRRMPVPRPGVSGGGWRGGTRVCCLKPRVWGKVTAFGWPKSDLNPSGSGREGGAAKCRQSRARAFLASSSSLLCSLFPLCSRFLAGAVSLQLALGCPDLPRCSGSQDRDNGDREVCTCPFPSALLLQGERRGFSRPEKDSLAWSGFCMGCNPGEPSPSPVAPWGELDSRAAALSQSRGLCGAQGSPW